MKESILHHFGLLPVEDEDTLMKIYKGQQSDSPEKCLEAWLQLLPEKIVTQIDAALHQKRPFLPPDVTPEMMAAQNDKIPAMNQMEILYRCLDFAMQAEDYRVAASVAFVVDRATYWHGASKALLKVVDMIQDLSPTTAIAPQVIVRKARVLKDDGDLHGAMTVLESVVSRAEDQPGKWKYRDNDQYVDTKAECVKIQGQILHNLGLWKEAIESLVESIRLFSSLEVKDDKGISSSLGLLTRCLGKLSLEDYYNVKEKFPEDFVTDHPCYESYLRGIEAVRYINDLNESLYRARHQLEADESLLKYAILRQSLQEEYQLFEQILSEMKSSLGAHKTLDSLKSSEQFFEFVRALFMISLTLAFSPVGQDRDLAEYLEQLSIELYRHLCSQSKGYLVAYLDHTSASLTVMNVALTLLGLPPLLGKLDNEDEKDMHDSGLSELDTVFSDGATPDTSQNLNSACEFSRNQDTTQTDSPLDSGTQADCFDSNSSDLSVCHSAPSDLKSLPSTGTGQSYDGKLDEFSTHQSDGNLTPEEHEFQCSSSTQIKDGKMVDLIKNQSGDEHLSEMSFPSIHCSVFSTNKPTSLSSLEFDKVSSSVTLGCNDTTSGQMIKNERSNPVCEFHGSVDNQYRQQQRPATYAFDVANVYDVWNTAPNKEHKTFPMMAPSSLSEEKNKWKVIKRKCVGLPIEPEGFSSLSSSDFDADISSSDVEEERLPLVNLSATAVTTTAKRLKVDVKAEESNLCQLVDLSASIQSSEPPNETSSKSEKFPKHLHDFPDQPMRIHDKSCPVSEEDGEVELSPLVDLSKSTVSDTFEKLHLGESVSTTDPKEYLVNWQPPHSTGDSGPKIQKAFVLNYNPATGHWTSQSTLAMIGAQLELASGQKGHCRDAFEVQFLHQDEPRGRYVGKRYRRQREPTHYMQDVVCQMMAGYYVIKFNQALQNHKSDIQVQFLPAAHLQLLTPDGQLENWINVEPYLHGDFIKLTNNLEYCNLRGRELATALTHFSYCESCGVLMIVDLQGWLPSKDSGVIYLTDPQFHTQGIEKFSPYDHQAAGMKKFWTKVHPECNSMCAALGLQRPDICDS